MSTEEIDLELTNEENIGYIEVNLAPWVKKQLKMGKTPADIKMPEGYYLNFYKKHKKFTITSGVLVIILEQ